MMTNVQRIKQLVSLIRLVSVGETCGFYFPSTLVARMLMRGLAPQSSAIVTSERT
jgi:ribonucleotide reductase beta subunit family protein with ferritin-like domain